MRQNMLYLMHMQKFTFVSQVVGYFWRDVSVRKLRLYVAVFKGWQVLLFVTYCL